MAYIASKISPTTRLIVAFLNSKDEPQSAIDISDGVGCSYWTAADIAKALVDAGELTVMMIGKSAHYALAEGGAANAV
jgi:hypothetical protein